MAGSPTAPMPIDASVMPTWLVAMYSSIRSICFSASAAPFAPSLVSDWMRSTRERTRAYSAPTKNAFMKMSAGTPTSRTISTPWSPARGETRHGMGRAGTAAAASYFEEGQDRASASDRRLPEPPGGSERRIQPRRPIALVLPDRHRAPTRARELRAPGVAAARAGVADQSGAAALRPGPSHRHRAHGCPTRARILEGDRGTPAAAEADRRRERRDLPGPVWVGLPVPAARARDEGVVLLMRLRAGRVALAPVRPGDQRLAACRQRGRGSVRELLLLRAVRAHTRLLAEARAAVRRQPREHAPVVALEVEPGDEHAPAGRRDPRSPCVVEARGELDGRAAVEPAPGAARADALVEHVRLRQGVVGRALAFVDPRGVDRVARAGGRERRLPLRGVRRRRRIERARLGEV